MSAWIQTRSRAVLTTACRVALFGLLGLTLGVAR